MVVQRDSIPKARTLLVNSTPSERPLEPVTLTILEDGVYQVTIFAIREGIGIVGSDVEYSTQITMNQEQGGLIQSCILSHCSCQGRIDPPKAGRGHATPV